MAKRIIRLTAAQATLLSEALYWIDSAGAYSEFWESLEPRSQPVWERLMDSVHSQVSAPLRRRRRATT